MNTYFSMNPNDNEEERKPNSFDVDDESDVYFLQQAYQYHETLVEDENRLVLTPNPIHRDREGAKDRLMDDYFDDHCRMSLSVIMKCTVAIRQLAYGITADAFAEYLQMSERTARDCLLYFNMCIIDLYMSKYLRKTTLEDVKKYIINMLRVMVFWECFEALIVCTRNRKNVQYHGRDNTCHGRDNTIGDKKYPTIMLKVVASHDMWIWHAFFGAAGANNDINVLDNSLLFDDLIDDKSSIALFVVWFQD
nr:hypothetical protein [Tanacetum cinerariifolium]